MARTVKDANLQTRTARAALKARGKPYYRTIDPGLHLGYRKPRTGAGKWVVRLYIGNIGKQDYSVDTIATADDVSEANGIDVLNFAQAQAACRSRRDDRSKESAGITGPYTVDDAMTAYLAFLDENRKSGEFSRYTYTAHIKAELGHIVIAELTTDRIRKWHGDLAKQPRRLRTRKGKAQKHVAAATDDDTKRRRRASANRILTVLKGALNYAWREGKVTCSDEAWRRVEPFENVDAARVRYLTVAEAKRLLNACKPDFRKLVQGALETGARYGELGRLRVADFNADAGTVTVRVSKGGKPRHIILTAEGHAFFKQMCAGRKGSELLFAKADGSAWGKSHQRDPMAAACEAAKIEPPATFHTLRHTWASHAVMNLVPLMIVARNLGHSDTRMVEKHYGHLAQDYVVKAIREGAPKFGFKPDAKIAALG